MNVVSYEYRDKRSSMPQFLYVDADYDKTKLPSNVLEIIKKSKVIRYVDFSVIRRMGEKVESKFVIQHYFDGVADMVEHSK